MKAVGIICEYNPFHNGHLYHLNKVKEMFKDYVVIVVMSSNFTERGDISIINKWDKTRIALLSGIDIVVEIPFVFATQAADIFAYAAINMLHSLNVEYVVFGSECNDIKKLERFASIQLNNPDYDNLVKSYLDEGLNYPSSLSKALENISGETITTPNDLLGISYIKEIKKIESSIIPLCIQRTNDFHSLESDNDVMSATGIRKLLLDKKAVDKYVPKCVTPYLESNIHFFDDYFSLLKYKVLSEKDLTKYHSVDEGLKTRIQKSIVKSKSIDELIEKIKTKRYTYNRIKRMLIHILCNFTKEEASRIKEIEYIRVLGFNKDGQKYLNEIKKKSIYPIITGYSNIKSLILDIEYRACSIYNINNEIEIEKEYKNSPIKM